jgi:hypothetical protein
VSEPTATSALARFTAALAASFRAPSSHTADHAQHPLDTQCHCLVVDESLLDKDSTNFQHFITAMTMAADRPALQAHVLEWL